MDKLQSIYASDPDMAELVALFSSEMPSRVNAISEAWKTSDMTLLARLSHQLRGASAGYGFPTLGTAAGKLEDLIKASQPDAAARLGDIERQVRELIDLCRRAA